LSSKLLGKHSSQPYPVVIFKTEKPLNKTHKKKDLSKSGTHIQVWKAKTQSCNSAGQEKLPLAHGTKNEQRLSPNRQKSSRI